MVISGTLPETNRKWTFHLRSSLQRTNRIFSKIFWTLPVWGIPRSDPNSTRWSFLRQGRIKTLLLRCHIRRSLISWRRKSRPSRCDTSVRRSMKLDRGRQLLRWKSGRIWLARSSRSSFPSWSSSSGSVYPFPVCVDGTWTELVSAATWRVDCSSNVMPPSWRCQSLGVICCSWRRPRQPERSIYSCALPRCHYPVTFRTCWRFRPRQLKSCSWPISSSNFWSVLPQVDASSTFDHNIIHRSSNVTILQPERLFFFKTADLRDTSVTGQAP